jgi:hypothetical protein
VGERRYINQFDITANLGWELDLWGKTKRARKSAICSISEFCCSASKCKKQFGGFYCDSVLSTLSFLMNRRKFSAIP